jgi:hypothetical protein
MAKSKARKHREKKQREGYLNPEINRGTWGDVNPMTKRTPALIEKQRKINFKHKKRFNQGERALDKPFLFVS